MRSSGEQITPETFYQQLARVEGPDLVAFARWVVENAPAQGLRVTWGKVGPQLQFAHENHASLPFMFGQLDRSGVLSQRQSAVLRRCEQLHVPLEIIRDYLKDLAALIPGACVKTFPLPGGDVKELVVSSEGAGPVDWPPLVPLALHKEEWLAAIDRAVVRIREVLDKRPNTKRLTGKPLPKNVRGTTIQAPARRIDSCPREKSSRRSPRSLDLHSSRPRRSFKRPSTPS